MNRIVSVEEKGSSQTMGSLKSAYRCGFSRGLTLGLLLLAVCIVLAGSLLYGEGSVDALFIDDQGTVKIQDLEVIGSVGIGTKDQKGKLDVYGSTRISDAMTVEGATELQSDLTVKGTVKADSFTGDGAKITLENNGPLKQALSKKVEGTAHLGVIGGLVNRDGRKEAGAGFEVKRQAKGFYLIIFKEPFSEIPAASVTQIYPDPNHFEQGGKTTDNAVICGINKEKVKVKTGDGNGNPDDRWFTFIIMGAR